MKRELEISCYTVESALIAEKCGADRIELCDNYSEGGTTPSYAAVRQAVNNLQIPVCVIIRPRGGDFLYSAMEYEIIREDVSVMKELNVNGIVFGFLKSNGSIDIDRTIEIAELARPMEVTFHRAFDMSNDLLNGLEQLKETGVIRILTSGARNTALKGISLLAELVERADDKISIMPGSGVNEHNLQELISKTGAWEFHSSAKIFKPSLMKYFNKNISMGGKTSVDEFKTITVDGTRVREMAGIIREH